MENQEAADASKSNASKKANPPRKHHYVPVFYQQNFVNDKGLLWVYDRQRETTKELHPRVVCCERDLYTVMPENKPHNTQVETDLLTVIDSFGSRGIRSFESHAPDMEAEANIAFFMAFQWTRVPTFSRDVRAVSAKLFEEASRTAFANVERAKALMDRYAAQQGKELKATPESLVAFVQGKQYEIVATETAFLAMMLTQARSLTNVLLNLNWEVLVAGKDTGFIICDCPVVVVPPKESNQVGFLVPGSAKYLPITRHLCLRLGELGVARAYRNVDKESVRLINQNIAANSERFIMGPSRLQLENVVARGGCTKTESTPRFTVESVESDQNGSLQKLSAQPRRYFYRKDGSDSAP